MSESSADQSPGRGRPIDLAGRDVPADDSPVPAGPATVPGGARPWREPDCLVLRFPFGYWSFVALFLIVLIAAAMVWGLRPAPPAQIALILVPFTLIWAWFLYRKTILPRVTFDQGEGLLTLGWRGARGRRPLSSVVGVQVMQTRKQFGGPDHNIPAVTMYQLNLILDDPAERRLNVMTCDPLTARSNARLVADFLGVPVLDSAGAAADTTAAAEPTPMECLTVPSPIVTEPGPDVLVIRPRRLAFLSVYRGMVGLMGMGVVGLLALAARDEWAIAAGVGVSLCSPLLLLGLLLLVARRAHFDRARGVLTLGWLGRGAPRPLASVKAVEVVDGPGYQLNLVPHDPNQPRLNLINDAEAALVRQAAERVASFLGVPLLDVRRQTPAAARPGAGEAVNPLEELDRSPLSFGKASIRGAARVVPKGDDGLVLRPRWPVSWRRLAPVLIMTGSGLYLAAWTAWLGPAAGRAGLGQSAGLLMVVLLGPLSLLSTVKPLLLYRNHFDRQAGLLTLGWFGLKGVHPLDKVLAVQLIPGGLVDKAVGRGGERVSYQLNLVLADAHQDRLNLTDDSDLEWTRQAGQQVADFLGVPAIDQIADDD